MLNIIINKYFLQVWELFFAQQIDNTEESIKKHKTIKFYLPKN